MKNIRFTGQFKKDLKHFLNQPKKLAKLNEILKILQNGEDIPIEFKPHQLKGDYNGCMECHIESDFLLIWWDEKSDTLVLYRLGSHS